LVKDGAKLGAISRNLVFNGSKFEFFLSELANNILNFNGDIPRELVRFELPAGSGEIYLGHINLNTIADYVNNAVYLCYDYPKDSFILVVYTNKYDVNLEEHMYYDHNLLVEFKENFTLDMIINQSLQVLRAA
jgi:hypothetical protein